MMEVNFVGESFHTTLCISIAMLPHLRHTLRVIVLLKFSSVNTKRNIHHGTT